MQPTSVSGLRSSDITSQNCVSELLGGEVGKLCHGHPPANSGLAVVLRDLTEVALENLESNRIFLLKLRITPMKLTCEIPP